MKTLATFVFRAVTEKDTFFGTKLKLMIVIWTKMRPADTTKNFEKCIVRNLIKETF
jgi:hypothetical protein